MAVLVFAPTPYQHALAERLTREIPGAEFVFLYTDESPDQKWALDTPEGVTTVHFQTGCPPVAEAGLLGQVKFYRRGGLIINWMKRAGARALVCYGYNDLGRVRLIRWCGRNRVPCFIASDANARQDALGRGLRQWLKGLRLRFILPSTAGVMVFGRPGVEFFARYGVPPARAFFVPYEPDYPALARGGDDEVARVRERFGLAAGRRRVVFCGRLIPFKRPDLAIDAFVRLADRRPNWDMVVIGDGPLRDAVRARVPDPLKDRVRWLGFVGQTATIGAVYRACDVLVLPSDIEPWGLVVNEALANGLAVVTSHVVGAAAHLVREGQPAQGANGRVFQRGDVASLVAALEDVTDPARVDAFKANSPKALAEYRALADPVAGMSRALAWVGLLHAR